MGVRILTKEGWLEVIYTYMWQKNKRGMEANVENEEIRGEMEGRFKVGREEDRPVIAMGDFNGRVGNMDDYIREVEDVPLRVPLDEYVNKHGESLIEFLRDAIVSR